MDAGFTIMELLAPDNVAVNALVEAGVTIQELREEGWTAWGLKNHHGAKLQQLMAWGFTCRELQDAGFAAATASWRELTF